MIPDAGSLKSWNEELARIRQQREKLESQIGERITGSQAYRQFMNTNIEKLKEALPENAALVDYYVYSREVFETKERTSSRVEPYLCAYVMRRDKPTMHIDLGPMSLVESAIEGWRTTFGGAEKGQDSGQVLRKVVWQPLLAYLDGVKVVLISPDEALGRLPFAALPGKKEGTYLIEEVSTLVVPIPQMLPMLAERQASGINGAHSLFVGPIDYNAGLEESPLDAHFLPLAGVADEMIAIRKQFTSTRGESDFLHLQGTSATESAVARHAVGSSYLHFATHGYFAQSGWDSSVSHTSRSRGATHLETRFASGDSRSDQSDWFSGLHPGVMSGIALAGDNRLPSASLPGDNSPDDGVLTALEVAEFELGDTELAVLSACETGLGKEVGGEGLLGLRRAFQVAGTRSVIASLWKVNDSATRHLMVRFYENLWGKGMSKLDAMQEAQLWMLREGGKEQADGTRGVVDFDATQPPTVDGRLPPYYWAAFVLSGDWR